MGAHNYQPIKFGAPAVPTSGGTVTLFDSTVYLKGGLAQNGVGRIRVSFPGLNQPSATNGLVTYSSPDHGAHWYQFPFGGSTLPATVAADTGTDHSAYDIFVGVEDDIKITYTATATAPTVWTPVIVAIVGDHKSGT